MAEEGSTEQVKKDLADLELLKPRLEREMLEDGAAHLRPGPTPTGSPHTMSAYEKFKCRKMSSANVRNDDHSVTGTPMRAIAAMVSFSTCCVGLVVHFAYKRPEVTR